MPNSVDNPMRPGVEHLHKEDYPLVLRLLEKGLGHRNTDVSKGYALTPYGAYVHWDWLIERSPLSSTEVATIRILQGMCVLERVWATPAWQIGPALSAALLGRWDETSDGPS